jgi:hypothetical protein
MRDLLISPEVASYIGAEAVHRLRAHPALPTARCVDCDRTLTLIDPTGPTAEWVGFHPPRPWLVRILDVPHCSLYLSPTPMRPDPQPPDFPTLQAAARQGMVVAALVDVDFLDPFGRPAHRVFDDVQHALTKAAPGGQGTPRRDRRHPPRGPH